MTGGTPMRAGPRRTRTRTNDLSGPTAAAVLQRAGRVSDLSLPPRSSPRPLLPTFLARPGQPRLPISFPGGRKVSTQTADVETEGSPGLLASPQCENELPNQGS